MKTQPTLTQPPAAATLEGRQDAPDRQHVCAQIVGFQRTAQAKTNDGRRRAAGPRPPLRRRASSPRDGAAGAGNLWGKRRASSFSSVGSSSDRRGSQLLRRSSSNSSARRGGVTWSSATRPGELHPTAGGRPCRSCLRVRTLEDSLRGCRAPHEEDHPPGGGGAHHHLLLRRQLWTRLFIREPLGGPSSCAGGLADCAVAELDAASSCGDRIGDDCDSDGVEVILVQRPTSIRWGSLETREHVILAGDNPSASDAGPVVCLGWDCVSAAQTSVDEYEAVRPPRRRLKQIKLNRQEREERLRETGVCEVEIRRSEQKVKRAQKNRKETLEKIKSNRFYEERALRQERTRMRLKRLLGMRKSDRREEEDLWDRAQQIGRCRLGQCHGRNS